MLYHIPLPSQETVGHVYLPDRAGEAELAEMLEGRDRECLLCYEERRLLSGEELREREDAEGSVEPGWGPTLAGQAYERLIDDLADTGVLSFSLAEGVDVGLFFVRKKGPDSCASSLMARRAARGL